MGRLPRVGPELAILILAFPTYEVLVVARAALSLSQNLVPAVQTVSRSRRFSCWHSRESGGMKGSHARFCGKGTPMQIWKHASVRYTASDSSGPPLSRQVLTGTNASPHSCRIGQETRKGCFRITHTQRRVMAGPALPFDAQRRLERLPQANFSCAPRPLGGEQRNEEKRRWH